MVRFLEEDTICVLLMVVLEIQVVTQLEILMILENYILGGSSSTSFQVSYYEVYKVIFE